MPIWVFAPIILLALVACPLSMWVMSKVMRRQVSCSMCRVGTGGEHHHSLEALEARRGAIEQEIGEVKGEIERNLNKERIAAKAGEG